MSSAPLTAQHPFALPISVAKGQSYQAPLLEGDDEVKEGKYIVRLFPGYTLMEHCRKLGKDGKDPNHIYIDPKLFTFVFENAIGYRCEAVTDETLHAIRADPGVEEVYHISAEEPFLE
jgi:hypothetical protein